MSARRSKFRRVLREAFNARPIGMGVPPNWLGIGLFGLLGVLNPGFWVLGAGFELLYLYTLSTNRRFQRLVAGKDRLAEARAWEGRVRALVLALPAEDQSRYRALEKRCEAILFDQKTTVDATGLEAQGESLARLLFIFLRLLLTRNAIRRVQREAQGGDETTKIEDRLKKLEASLQAPNLSEDLKRSMKGQIEILGQRLGNQRQASEKLVFLDAELTRIQEQVELIREQAVLVTDPNAVSERIDEVSATLGGTTQWIHEQQQIYGQIEDLLSDAKPVLVPAAMRASQ